MGEWREMGGPASSGLGGAGKSAPFRGAAPGCPGIPRGVSKPGRGPRGGEVERREGRAHRDGPPRLATGRLYWPLGTRGPESSRPQETWTGGGRSEEPQTLPWGQRDTFPRAPLGSWGTRAACRQGAQCSSSSARLGGDHGQQWEPGPREGGRPSGVRSSHNPEGPFRAAFPRTGRGG